MNLYPLSSPRRLLLRFLCHISHAVDGIRLPICTMYTTIDLADGSTSPVQKKNLLYRKWFLCNVKQQGLLPAFLYHTHFLKKEPFYSRVYSVGFEWRRVICYPILGIYTGSMLCTFQVFLGAQAGVTLLVFSDWKSRIIRWLSWSVLTGAIGTVLCLASQNDGWIPVNKNLWYVYSYYIIDDSPSLTNIHLISLYSWFR